MTPEQAKSAHFFHAALAPGGLTYQCCRFCGTGAFHNYDTQHHNTKKESQCWREENTGEPCRGLWKYNVRHYVCTPCRDNVLSGLPTNPNVQRKDR